MNNLRKLIDVALQEDQARQDITSRLIIPSGQRSTAYIVFKEQGVLCGVDIARQIYRRLSPGIKFTALHKDGAKIRPGEKVAKITGNTRVILAGERTVINFLMHLSGVATCANHFVHAAGKTHAKILDTRKTLPGLRELEKYAVRCGGGTNHRMNLSEMVLIKDNHLAALKDKKAIAQIIRQVRQKTRKPVEIEVTSLKELRHACGASPDVILLDNMRPSCMKDAVIYLRRKKNERRILLEASGGISLKNIRQIAKTGVDRISIGAMTHSAKAVNISLEFTTSR